MSLKYVLSSQESIPVSVAGSQFYFVKGTGKILVKALSGGDTRDFELSPGMGFRNEAGEQNFSGLEIKNIDADPQLIEIEISYRQVFDNRVTFVSDGYLPVHPVGTGVVDTINVSKQNVVFSNVHIGANLKRKKIVLSFDGGDWWVGSTTNYPDDYYRKLNADDDFVLEGCTSDLWIYTNDTGNLYTFEVVENN